MMLALSLIDKRDDWTKLIMELERVMPDTMWLTYMEPFNDITQTRRVVGSAAGGVDPMMMMMMGGMAPGGGAVVAILLWAG